MAHDDLELLERIKRGDGESFGTLYDRTRKWLLAFVIIPRVGRGDSDEVLAETFRFALGAIRGFRWRGVGLVHWLAAIAKRKSLEHARRRSARLVALEDVPNLLELPSETPTAEAEMIRLETLKALRERVNSTLGRVSPRYAATLRLRLLEGRSREECARQMAVSAPTFDVIFHRATRAFAREWSRP